MDELEAVRHAHRVRMLVCNRMYEHAHRLISELTNLRVYVTVIDDGYNEWERSNERANQGAR